MQKTQRGSVSIGDIQRELSCSVDRAREIMLFDLPHYDISSTGAKRKTWRAKRKDFEAWLAKREHEAGIESIKRFSAKFMGGRAV